ncbi:AAA family ATPase [uncultured Holdemanella sp.]|uniref:ATP-binding protein n=1 Tax=uncultured Holdemanella sp. TaxID=1763549 RepID=UPI0025CD1ACF|nr:AAA family ATPase [uncultured Holdemanella sp.]
MKREIFNQLEVWKKSENKKPLIIKGARQVGKTYIVRHFAKYSYSEMVEVNFEKDLEFQHVFEKTHNPKEILDYFRLRFSEYKFTNDTLLFMDEIQACPDALTTLKFMAEDFPCDIICSGSLLGVAIQRTTSYPVRYVDTIDMFPMSFMEFLEAKTSQLSIRQKLTECIKNKIPMPDIIHEQLNQLFSIYMIIGGMPEVVQTYINTESILEAKRIQEAILDDYIRDMSKYASGAESIKIKECFMSIPSQLAKENKKFQYKLVKQGYNARYYEESLRWLEDSGLILKVNRLNHIDYPLSGCVELPIFKIYMADIGLFVSQLEDGDIRELLLGEMGIYKGALYESVVAQIFRKKKKKCYYFEPSQNSEIDFIIEYNGYISPVEVKSSRNTVSKSFQNYIQKYNPKYSFRFSQKNFGYDSEKNIYYIPFYAIEVLLNNEPSPFESFVGVKISNE